MTPATALRSLSEASEPVWERSRAGAESPGLRAAFSWTFLGNLVYAGCQWGMLVVLAKLGTPEMVGRFALGLAICAPVILLANMALRPVLATDTRRQFEFGHYAALRCITVPLALFFIGATALLLNYPAETTWVICLVGIAKGIESFSDLVYGVLQQNERMNRIAHSMIGRGLLGLTVFALAMYLTREVVWSVTGLVLASLFVLVAYDTRSASRVLRRVSSSPGGWSTFNPRWQPHVLSKLARLAFPVGIATMLLSLVPNVPRYFVDRCLGERELGIYSALTYLTLAAGMSVIALGQSASPKLARLYAERNSIAYRKLLLKVTGLGATIGATALLAVMLYGREILTVVYRPEYAAHADTLLWLTAVFAAGSILTPLAFGMTASRQLRAQPVLFGLAATVGGVSCYFLVPTHGLQGAAWAYGASVITGLAGALLSNLHAIRSITERPRTAPTRWLTAAQIKRLGRCAARFITAFASVRGALRKATLAGCLPNWVWKRLPVDSTYRITIHPNAEFGYISHPNDVIGRALYWRGLKDWEHETITVITRLCPRARCFIDVGANTGVYTLVACAVNPKLTVIAFEPVPHIYQRLCENVELNDWRHRCSLRDEAVSSRVGNARLHVPDSDLPSSASLNPHGFRGIRGRLIDVRVTTLDSAVGTTVPVDLVKVDVEGFEPEVLQGMHQILARSEPILILECNPDGPFRAIESFLRPYGYKFYHLAGAEPTPSRHIVPDPSGRYRNYLCLSDSRKAWLA